MAVCSIFPLCGFQAWNLGPQVWQAKCLYQMSHLAAPIEERFFLKAPVLVHTPSDSD